MFISDQPVGSGKVSITTARAKETQQSGRQTLQTGSVATQMARDDYKKLSPKTLVIALVVVALALVMIVCLVVAWLCLRERKR